MNVTVFYPWFMNVSLVRRQPQPDLTQNCFPLGEFSTIVVRKSEKSNNGERVSAINCSVKL